MPATNRRLLKPGNPTLKVARARTIVAPRSARYLCHMRFRPLSFLLLPLLLAACAKTNAPLRLDFIGLTNLVSGARTVNPSDTLASRVYAVSFDHQLQRLHIAVTYAPGLSPILYPVPLTGYNSNNNPDAITITYLDSLIKPIPGSSSRNSPGSQYLFVNRFTARTTSGTELWQYTASDDGGKSTTRAYRLAARKVDSAAVYHNYTLAMHPRPRTKAVADSVRDQARVFLNLPFGLLLPKYAVLNNERTVQPNQQFIDLICTVRGNSLAWEAPATTAQDSFLLAGKWPVRRATLLRRTSLTVDAFTKAVTTDAFTTAFNSGTEFADPYSTGTLTKTQVLAFKTVEGKVGLMQVVDIVPGTKPLLTCTVKVQK